MKVNRNFLKNFKKNDIVIYAIALMLVTAGYFNYTANLDNISLETYSEDISETVATDTETDFDSDDGNEIEDDSTSIGEAELVNSDDVIDETDIEETETSESLEENTEEVEETEETTDDEIESNDDDSSDYFVSTKLERDQNYASMISTYTQIVEDESISETQKSIAMNEITEINDTINAISVCENVLSTKGFTNLVVLVNGDSVNVVVSVDGGLTNDKVAQIQNVVSRELSADIENIHITENN